MGSSLKVSAINLDCEEPKELAAFYQRITGYEVVPDSDDDFMALTAGNGLWLGFQRVEGYRAPEWPDQGVPQQLHIDFRAGDLDEAEAMLLELGAKKPETQPGGDRWRVFLDPAGHPFCVVSH